MSSLRRSQSYQRHHRIRLNLVQEVVAPILASFGLSCTRDGAAGIGTTPGKRMNGIRLKASTNAQPPSIMALPQTMVLWVVEHRLLCSEAINPLECTRTLAIPPQPPATQLMDDRTARHPSFPTHLPILLHICSSTRYLEQGWKEFAPPNSRATSTQATHLSLPIPTSRRPTSRRW